MRARGRSRLGALLLLVTSSVVGFLAAEGVVRLVAPQPLRPAWEDELAGIRVAHPGVRGRHLQPGKFDVTVTINTQRFRSRGEYAPEPGPGVTRIAVLGDSMAFGWGAEDEETYPAQLQGILRRARPVEVINAGFPGTCLGEKAVGYTLTVRSLHPHVVILTVLGDDVDGDLYWRVFALDSQGDAALSTPPRRGPAGPAVRPVRDLFKGLPGSAFLAERSQLFGLLRRAVTRAVSRERTTSLGKVPATEEEVDRFRKEGLALLKAEVRWLREEVRRDGARLVAVFVPFRDSVYVSEGWWPDEIRWKSRAVSESLVEVCAGAGVPFLDITPILAERAKLGAGALYYDGVETHPTPEGYRAIAEAVAAFLVEARVGVSEPGGAASHPLELRSPLVTGGSPRPQEARRPREPHDPPPGGKQQSNQGTSGHRARAERQEQGPEGRATKERDGRRRWLGNARPSADPDNPSEDCLGVTDGWIGQRPSVASSEDPGSRIRAGLDPVHDHLALREERNDVSDGTGLAAAEEQLGPGGHRWLHAGAAETRPENPSTLLPQCGGRRQILNPEDSLLRRGPVLRHGITLDSAPEATSQAGRSRPSPLPHRSTGSGMAVSPSRVGSGRTSPFRSRLR